jgi:hypothetical protein
MLNPKVTKLSSLGRGKELKMISRIFIRKFITVWVAAAILIVYTTLISATPGAHSARLSVVGIVTVDDQQVVSGGTFFSDSTIATGPDSSATLTLGRYGRIELQANSSLTLSLTDKGLSGSLSAGRGRVLTPAGISVNLTTKDGAVVVDGREATSFMVDTNHDNTMVTTESGLAKLRSKNGVEEIAAGENGVATAYPPQQFVARLTTTGNRPITVNGTSAAGGATLLTGVTIETPAGVGATIDLGELGVLDIAPNTELTLVFDPSGNGSVKVTLRRGCALLKTKRRVIGQIDTPQGPAATTDPNTNRKKIDVCFPLGASEPTVNQGAAAAAGAGAGGAVAGSEINPLWWLALVGGGVIIAIILGTRGGGTTPTPVPVPIPISGST